jgi:uroporphyrinogen-III synthase
MPPPNFEGLSVLTLESRRSAEQATLIQRFGGTPLVAPSMREVPLSTQGEAIAFVHKLVDGQFDCVVLLTGVGTRALAAVAAEQGVRDAFVAALGHVRVVARGPKPLTVLRELNVPVWLTAPEPNTWREVISAIDAASQSFSIRRARVAVQEYGVSNPNLLEALRDRGAVVTTVPIYEWALPEDVGPLRLAVNAVLAGGVQVLVLTSGVQLAHLWQVAKEMGQEERLRDALARVVIASIGPTTTEEIRRRGLAPDLEASHPKMGVLITETAVRAREIFEQKARS